MSTLSQLLKKAERTPISFDQIKNILPASMRHKTVMRTLDNLPEKCTDKDIFGDGENCCLYCTRYDSMGSVVANHWVVLLLKKSKKNSNRQPYVEWSDSLGNNIQGLLHKLGSIKSQGLLYWKRNRRGRLFESTHQFQGDNMEDCGDFAAIRICFRHLTNKQYRRFITNSPLNPDMTVSLLSYIPLHLQASDP